MHKNLVNKYGSWALIAGASEGLGAAFANAAAKKGMNLILLARREEKLRELSETIKVNYPIDIKYYVIDLSDYSQVETLLHTINIPIGLLIYNAAYAPIGYFEHLSEDDLANVVNVNIKAPLLITKWVSNQMIERQKGGIILMSSLSGTQGSPKIATYSASKAFNTLLAEGLWKELKKHKIDVIASCAGAILTPGYIESQQAKAPGTLTPMQVAEKTLKALGSQPIIVPGIINKIAHFFMGRILPIKTAIHIMDKNTKTLS